MCGVHTIIKLEFDLIEIHFKPTGHILQMIHMGINEVDKKVGNTGGNRGIYRLIRNMVIHGEKKLKHVFLDMGTLLFHLFFRLFSITITVIMIHGGLI